MNTRLPDAAMIPAARAAARGYTLGTVITVMSLSKPEAASPPQTTTISTLHRDIALRIDSITRRTLLAESVASMIDMSCWFAIRSDATA